MSNPWIGRCPNCLTPMPDHPENGCVLAAFIQVLRDRDNLSAEALLELHNECNVDQLWDDLGPILDRLEEGFYNVKEEA